MPGLTRVFYCLAFTAGNFLAYPLAVLTLPPGAGRTVVVLLGGFVACRLLEPYIYQPETGD
jgi:hypothetical protein